MNDKNIIDERNAIATIQKNIEQLKIKILEQEQLLDELLGENQEDDVEDNEEPESKVN